MKCLFQSLSLVASLCMTCVLAHGVFRDIIPNGYNVPDPCHPGATWQGFGHQSPAGSNTINAFGKTFRDLGSNQWTRAVCQADSDGDGKTNGEELGDPDCTWMPGDTAPTLPLGHPGVCEPVTDPKCQKVNCPWLTCGCDNDVTHDVTDDVSVDVTNDVVGDVTGDVVGDVASDVAGGDVTLAVCVTSEDGGHAVRVHHRGAAHRVLAHDRVSSARARRSVVRMFRVTEERRCRLISLPSLSHLHSDIASMLPADFLPFGTHCTPLVDSASLCNLLTR